VVYLKYVDTFLKLMKDLTGNQDYVIANEKGGINSMFDALQYEKNEGRKQGFEQGLARGEVIGVIKTLYFRLNESPEEIAINVNEPIEFVKEVLNL